jgi:hypothetical protein
MGCISYLYICLYAQFEVLWTASCLRASTTRLQDLSMFSSFCKKPLARSSRREARRLVSRRGRPVPRGRTDANRRVVHLVLSRRRGGQDLARPPRAPPPSPKLGTKLAHLPSSAFPSSLSRSSRQNRVRRDVHVRPWEKGR